MIEQNDKLFEKALELSGINRNLVVNHGYCKRFNMSNDVKCDFKQRGYLLQIDNGYNGWFPIVFFFDEE